MNANEPSHRQGALTPADRASGLLHVAHVRAGEAAAHTMLPTPLVVFALQLGEPIASEEAGGRTESALATVTGSRRVPVRYSVPADAACLVAFCSPSYASRVLGGQPLASVAGTRLALAAVAPALAAELLRVRSGAGALGVFTQLLRTAHAQAPAPGLGARRAFTIAEHLLQGKVPASLAPWAAQWQVSRRMLEQDLARWAGATAGELQRLARLHGALRLVRQGLPLAEAAAEAGYADQPHMHRSLHRATSMTPSQWRSRPRGWLQERYRLHLGGQDILA